MKRCSYVVLLMLGALAVGCEEKKPEPTAASSASVKPAASPVVSATPAPKDDGVTFAKKAPKVGQKREQKRSMEMKLTIKIAGHDQLMETAERETKKEEILEVSGNAITKLKVTFVEKAEVGKDKDGKEQVKASPVSGKTYIVVAKDGKVTVLDEKEKPAPKAQADLVAAEYHTLGKPDPLSEGIPDRALKPGDKIPELLESLKKFMREGKEDDAFELTDATVTFKGKEGENGLFEIAFTMSKGDKDMKMKMPLKGRAVVRLVDSQPVEVAMEGTVELGAGTAPPQGAPVPSGSGSMKLRMTTTYE